MKFVGSAVALFTVAFAAPAAAQAVLTLDLSAYPPGTTIDQVNEPGFAFVAPNPANIVILPGNILRVTATPGSSEDLRIVLTRGSVQSSLAYIGEGTCTIAGFDRISRVLGPTVVNTLVTFQLPNGRCASGISDVTASADSIVIDIADPNQRQLLSAISYTPTPPVPTLSEWASIVLGVLLAGVALSLIRRRRRLAEA